MLQNSPPTATADPFLATAYGARHAAYAALAATGPVHRIMTPAGVEAWLVTGYDEAREALTDPRFIRAAGMSAQFADAIPPAVAAAVFTHMLRMNPPDHTRLRRLVSAAFTRRRIDLLQPRVQEIADELLGELDVNAEIDLVETYAFPLPMTVICELLGVPEPMRADFRASSAAIAAGQFVGVDAFVAGATTMAECARELLAVKRVHPGDDLLSALVAVRDVASVGTGPDRLTEDELSSMVFLLVVAGHETTVHLIANGTHALLTRPDALDRVRADPALLPHVVEELLRIDGSVQAGLPLTTVEPVELGRELIPAGATVLVGLLAANRDVRRFDAPDVLDIDRAEIGHIAFGHGVHHCLGAPLARLEARIALGTLITRFPQLRLAVPSDELAYGRSSVLHGLTRLPVVLDGG